MTHFSKALFIASLGLMAPNIASSDDQGLTNLNFNDPRYNVVDDLSDYGGDQRWPSAEIAAEPEAKEITSATPEVRSVSEVPNDLNFQESRYNIVDDLSDYGGDYRWPVSVTDFGGEDIVGVNGPVEDLNPNGSH